MPQLPVSVIIPVRNRETMVGAAVRSALGQEPDPPAEAIVVDDASTDASASVAGTAGATVVRLAHHQGVAAARNAGIAAARHPWIAFLDSDDTWAPQLLDRLWAQRHGHVIVGGALIGAVTGRVQGNPTRRSLILTGPADVFAPENVIATSATLVDKAALLEAGGFRDGVPEDLDAWLRLLERGPGLVLPDHVGTYGEHPGQMVRDSVGGRAGVRDLMRRYDGRPWLTPTVRDRIEIATRWDELRDANSAAAVRRASWFAARPRRAAGIVKLWRWRYQARHPRPPI